MRSFNGSFPHWRLSGHEYNELRREEVLNLPGVSDFHSGPLQTGIGQYDMVSMIYVVEHLPNLAEVMSTIRQLLVPGGLFFVHTSHYETNPFDLTVRDHCSHFRPDTLALVGHTAGFTPVVDGSSWIAKEIGMLFRAGQSEQAISFTAPSGSLCGQQLLGNLRWLAGLAADAHRAAKGGLGVFGTAIAGTWLANELGDAATFFVDEDESRQGKLHLGRPVLAPAQLSPSMPVYLPFPMGLAERLHARLSRSLQEIRFLLPPRGI
jgi:SAM-dependent methyltransferase